MYTVDFKLMSHGFIVKADHINPWSTIMGFVNKFMEVSYIKDWRTGTVKRIEGAIYAIVDEDKMNVVLPIGAMFDLEELLNKSYNERITINKVQHLTPLEQQYPSNPIVMKPEFTPRDYQEDIVKFMIEPNKKFRVLPLRTGGGKTFISIYSLAQLGKRAALFMQPREVATWVKNFEEKCEMDKFTIEVIQGGKSFRKLVDNCEQGIRPDVIIFSIQTFQNFINESITAVEDNTYGVTPMELFKLLDVEIAVTDESHEWTHAHCLFAITTCVKSRWYLSATLQSNSSFNNLIYRTLYPADDRYQQSAFDKYIQGIALGYNLETNRIPLTKGAMGYSHAKLEKFILRLKRTFLHYMDILVDQIEKHHIPYRKENMKVLIFFSLTEMCERACKVLQETYPELKVIAYNGGDETKMLESDIILGTPQSVGTGKDIPGLQLVINTVAVGARERNMQMVGRLRPIDKMFPNVPAMYIYLVCKDISAHIEYHLQRQRMLRDVLKSLHVIDTVRRV